MGNLRGGELPRLRVSGKFECPSNFLHIPLNLLSPLKMFNTAFILTYFFLIAAVR